MKTWIKQIVRKIIPTDVRAWIYTWMFRFENLKSGFWKVIKKKSPKVFSFIQRIIVEIYLKHLSFNFPDTYHRLVNAQLPERLLRTVIFRLALQKKWRKFPELPDLPLIKTDVLFVSYSAHPDLVKMCIALKRSRPGIHCTLIANRHAHTQSLCAQWFDNVMIVGKNNDLAMISAIQNAEAKSVVMRFRDVVFHTLAVLYHTAPLIYYPPGFFLSSQSEDFLSDPELTFDETFEADKYLLERVQGIFHFLSDNAIVWFKERGVKICCPDATLYTACLSEQTPSKYLPKLSENDGEWHIVHATGVESVDRDPKKGGGAFLPIEKCRIVVSQGIHMHIYGTYLDRKAPGYAPYVELEKQSKFFHIEDNLEFDQLQIAMTKYDLAWKHWDISVIPYWSQFADYVTPNFFAYLQSGVPLLMSEKMPFREREIALQNNLGIAINDSELKNLATILKNQRDSIKLMSQSAIASSTGVLSYQFDNLLKVMGPCLDR
jgi:hypothetical protein